MQIDHVAAFCHGGVGGNPAGVAVMKVWPADAVMQRAAAEIGYSETAFAVREGAGWRVRYFSPLAEVPFCGHATIALGSVLAARFGAGTFPLYLTQGEIAVRAEAERAELTSPPTRSEVLGDWALGQVLDLFDLNADDLDPRMPPRLAFAGARHAVLLLRNRARLVAMAYPFDPVRALMQAEDWTTIALVVETGPLAFAARNAFAVGGVVEDPATGAAAAALGGALVDVGWPGLAGARRFTIAQGDDMGAPSRLQVQVTGRAGDPVNVSGAARIMRRPTILGSPDP